MYLEAKKACFYIWISLDHFHIPIVKFEIEASDDVLIWGTKTLAVHSMLWYSILSVM